ncbi:ATP-binding protein [Leptospira perdikensis]|uniref:histidine kinase n=1 Tax=Leptospira perdikensis TaxID=2484948 RepID=A0A4R9J787_9LEPT|nr:ATP-binding protein [Leptospira perdikensis]TGL33608.1 histidine kinase [Leptospira perdikensis]
MKPFYTLSTLFLIWFSIHSCTNLKTESPKLKLGVLNLSNHSFSQKPVIPLAGEWKFTPGRLDVTENSDTILVTIPDTPHWNSYNSNNDDSFMGFGIGSYFFTIIPPKEPTTLSLDFNVIFSDCEIYQNGILMGSIGNIHGKEDGFDRRPMQTVLLPTKNEPIHISILLRNRFYQAGGIRFLPLLGTSEYLATVRDKEIFEQSLIVGGLFFLGLYQLGVFFTRGRIIGSLFLFLFCQIMAFQILATGTRSLFLILGENSSELVFRINFFSQYAGAIAGLYYFYSLTKEYLSSYFIHTMAGIILIPVANTVFGPIYLISYLHLYVLTALTFLLAIAIYLIIRYIKDKRYGYIYLGLSSILLIGCAGNDIILSLLNKTEPMVLSYGLLLFVFFQSLFLSKHISNEILTAELDLKAAKYQLVQSEKMSSLGVMIASVAHEINSPLSAVIASSTAIAERMTEHFRLLPETKPIPKETFPIFLSLVELALTQNELIPTKEMRQNKRDLTNYLESLGLTDVETKADLFVSLGIREIPEDWVPVLTNNEGTSFFVIAERVVSILQGTKTIRIAANRAIKIAESLKKFTHFDPKGEKQTIILSDSLDMVLTIFESSMKRGIELITEFEEIPPIECYPDELNQVWTNMIQNAIQSMNGKGNLKIKIGEKENEGKFYVFVSIEDSGPGIPKDVESKIFDPFFTTKPIGEGTGLGLYITKQVIEKHKGIIDLETKPGKTVFTILLPQKTD